MPSVILRPVLCLALAALLAGPATAETASGEILFQRYDDGGEYRAAAQ